MKFLSIRVYGFSQETDSETEGSSHVLCHQQIHRKEIHAIVRMWVHTSSPGETKMKNTFGEEQKRRKVLCFLELAVSPVGYVTCSVLANTDAAARFCCLGSSRSIRGIGTKDTHSRLEKKAGAWENELQCSEDFKHQSWKTTGINWITSKGGCLGHVFYLNSMQGAHLKIFIKPSMIAALGEQSPWTLAFYVYWAAEKIS